MNDTLLTEQIEALKVYFDNEHIYNLYDEITKLNPFEFSRVKLIIKNEKEDDVYVVSQRISVQLMNGMAYIVKNIKHGTKPRRKDLY